MCDLPKKEKKDYFGICGELQAAKAELAKLRKENEKLKDFSDGLLTDIETLTANRRLMVQ